MEDRNPRHDIVAGQLTYQGLRMGWQLEPSSQEHIPDTCISQNQKQ